ncbi:MAG: energy transducer TonB [Oceanipulchritudo sp.]
MKLTLISVLGAALLLGAGPLLGETTDPKLLEGEMPSYTDEARQHGAEGTVVIEALVDESGRVFAAEVVESVDSELDNVTLAAIETWKFQPALEDGRKVMKVVRIPVNYNLIDPLQENVLRAHDQAIAVRD